MMSGSAARRLGWLLALAAAAGGQVAAAPAANAPPGAAAAGRASEAALCLPADTSGEIAASVYSFPASMISAAAASDLLAAVRRLAPERTLVVLSDLPLASAAGTVQVSPGEAGFSPWPRDPFSLAREPGGRVRILERPNLQPGREADAVLGRALLAGLPPELRRAWGDPIAVTAPVPFHNGQILASPDALWLSIHSVEPRALALLGLARVPVETFSRPGGAERYAAAVQTAAGELGALYGRSARFVHPLPDGGADDPALMARLGGGAGVDLDSVVTLLEGADGRLRALVGDLELGAASLPLANDAAWEGFRRGYGIGAAPADLRAALLAAQRAPAGEALGVFLELVADHLAAQEIDVARLPLLRVPVSLLGRPELEHPDFLITWNNVVVSGPPRTGLRAEGFSSLLPPLDAEATRRYAAAGAELALLPPLVESVVRNGGYRCASNHLRAAGCPAAGAERGGEASR